MASAFPFLPLDAEYPVSPPPFLSVDAQGNAFLGFDPGTDETAQWTRIAPSGLDVGGNQTAYIYWRADTATSGNVIWAVQVEAVTPDDALDTDAASSFAAVQTVTDAAPGTAGYVTRAAIPLTVAQADSLAAGDKFRIRIARDANNASDTMAGDAEILGAEWDDNA